MPGSFSPTAGFFSSLTPARYLLSDWLTLQGNLGISVNENKL